MSRAIACASGTGGRSAGGPGEGCAPLPRVLAVHHTRIVPPLLGLEAPLQERLAWVTEEVCEQLRAVLPEHPDGHWQHLICTTSLSTLVSANRDACSALFNQIERACNVRPLALIQQYQCTGWGFGMRFAGKQTGARLLALSIVDVDLHDAIAKGFTDAIGRVGFGITTVALRLPPGAELPQCAGPFPNRAFADLAHAIRALHRRAGPSRTFMPFLPPGLAELSERLIGADRLAPNRYDVHGHCFGSDPWIGIVEWLGQERLQQDTPVTLGSFAYDGYYTAGHVLLGPDTEVSMSRCDLHQGRPLRRTEFRRLAA